MSGSNRFRSGLDPKNQKGSGGRSQRRRSDCGVICFCSSSSSSSSSPSPFSVVDSARIKLVGVEGGGNNADVEFYVRNTDAQALLNSAAKNPLQIGEVH
ncbi:hypothetical protein MRB53_030087 [Persea americana]|uniref:Uncharacterized protein n=1 Tax=Persea americana TaxID=3435 RepID=A0ACC2KKJ6_PERAE|nr:hypothetical protein MRB53_030087 [Persea americana]